MTNTIHNKIQIHTSLCQQTNMCMAEDIGAELFVDIGEGTETSDGLVEHLDGRGMPSLSPNKKSDFIHSRSSRH